MTPPQLLWFSVHSPFWKKGQILTGFVEESIQSNLATLHTLIITYGFLSVSSEFLLPGACIVIIDAQQVIEKSTII